MINKKFKKTILILGGVSIILGSTVVFSEPGSEKDPLVSLSYLEKQIDQLKYYIDEKFSSIEDEESTSSALEVVEISEGQSIIGKSGTEIILRGGKAEIIAGELGGLSDITDGKDLKMGANVPPNHLLIVPRDDERGVYAITDSIYLVRGEYEIR
ncbi:hypothetical protein [Schnuerera sp.]|uniref:hypothetical protein n=1 Tax=Schnuerera sp. TaxID=2794844 RepID=UPI002B813228|nr:hypothetical protein [Schnuerera sp.]HSH35936.1 hypothetical protein [Schnuerera sp.]